MTELPIYDLVINNGLLAQMIEDPDILGQMSDAWKNFVESGQIWALLIGVFFGYIFASFTRF
ncbi:hypothetical protein [Cyanobacterium sp. Dongsha4]|uniref:hypothetical protein n=1 Tax=Cyanobacterium sp. DS4 TaxID=2878255 RepID=UPI002E81F813|nr:hypothetical protein [Cyanobacterium sp. Dongsha4]WVL01748.1 hypothetical protein Dongsha4_06040 [Cyanobacterium sp. Dongsha4]